MSAAPAPSFLFHRDAEVDEAARGRQRLYVCRTEAGADALWAAGLAGVTPVGGWNVWRACDGHSARLKGADVAVLQPPRREPDPDLLAYLVRRDAEHVVKSLLAFGCTVRPVDLPGLDPDADIDAHFLDGTGAVALERLAAAVEPIRLRRRPDPAPATPWAAAVAATASPQGRGPSQADRLVHLALEAGAVLFHDREGETYATVEVAAHDDIAAHAETWPLHSKGFRSWLQHRFFVAEAKAATPQALVAALGVLDGRARFEGPESPVWTRVARVGDTLYLDLADPEWRIVEVTARGWRVCARSPVTFRRPRGMKPLPAPTSGGSLGALRPLVNVPDDDAWRLVLAWLVATLRPDRPFCVLCLHGEQGSAKSTLARVLRALVDPNVAPLRSAPKETRDLMIAAKNGWVVAFDNLSHISPALSDDLCRLATGGGFGTRTLYENDDETLFDAMRPVLVNGITDLATRGDLLDRGLLVTLPPIAEAARRPEAALWPAFEAARPALLGALLDAAVMAVTRLPTTTVTPLPRMADFALWAEAAAPAFGWREGAVTATYRANRADAHDLALDASPVGEAVVTLLARQPTWEGNATALLAALGALVAESVRALPSWPKTGRGLRGAVDRVTPNLRAVGITVTDLARHSESRGLRLTRTEPDRAGVSTVTTVTTVTDGRKCARDQGLAGDGRAGGDDGRADDRHPPSSDRHPLSARNPSGRDGRDGHDGCPSAPDGPAPDGRGERLRQRLAARGWAGLRRRSGVTAGGDERAWGIWLSRATLDDLTWLEQHLDAADAAASQGDAG